MKLALSFALIGCSAAVAHADLSYTQSTAMSFGGMIPGGSTTTSKMAMKGSSTRMETSALGTKMIIISKPGSSTQIDPETKTYTVSSGAPKPVGGMMPKGGPSEIDISVKKLGFDTVRGIKAPHWQINMKMKLSTQRGPQTLNMMSEIWSSTTPYPQTAAKGALDKLPMQVRGMFGTKVKVNGDVKSMGAAYATVPLRMKMFMNGNSMGTTETTKISTDNLPASMFAVPAGYRKITEQQWSKMQRDAMMKKMGGMMKGLPGMGR